MAWLLLSILTNSALLLILKGFTRFGVNTLQGIVVNYVTAGSLGLLLGGIPVSFSSVLHTNWIWIPPVLGMLFISVFFLIARTAQTMGVSVATVANKMSVVMPVAAALIFYHEHFSIIQVIGMALTLVAVYLTAMPAKSEGPKAENKFWLPALVFIGSGIIDSLVNEAKHKVSDELLSFFISLCFLSAFVIGISIVTGRIIIKKEKFAGKSILAGILLGIPNYFSIYGIAKALGSNFLPGSALYPLNNMGIVLASAAGAFFLFREKLSIPNWIGIALSVSAISLIAFG